MSNLRITPTDVANARTALETLDTTQFRGYRGPHAWHEAGAVADALHRSDLFPDFIGGLVTDPTDPTDPTAHWLAIGVHPDTVDFDADDVTNHGPNVTADYDATGDDAALAWALGMIDESRNPDTIENRTRDLED